MAGRVLSVQPRGRKNDPSPWDRLKNEAQQSNDDDEEDADQKDVVEDLMEEREKRRKSRSHQGAGLVKTTSNGCSIM